MIKVDENDPIGEVELSFPYRDVQIKKNVDVKDEYTLEGEIGRGKFGTVYKCKEKSTGLCLAAKFVSCPKKEDKRNVEREIEIMRLLQHPRLIQIYDALENGKVMSVILELIEGGELFERVIDDDFILTEKACTIFMRQICEGVEFIHKQKILHLDMKPENILCLTKTGNRIKIIDFGLARKFDPSKKLQVLFGTPEFVAPEVVNFDAIGYGTDMWSVGVICYVLLSGLSPFMGSTDVETMANVTVAKYDFDDEAFQNISENAKDFIKKLLLKDMNQRMTADQCLKHDWLKRKKSTVQRISSMDVNKENLRQFVERWNEHPNSPYIFEIANGFIPAFDSDKCNGVDLLSNNHDNDESHSLGGDSPSPCGSISSELENDDDDAFSNNNNNNNNNNNIEIDINPKSFVHPNKLAVNLDCFRRSSDSNCFMKNQDITERINLAREIKTLSDKLIRLSNLDTTLTSDDQSLDSPDMKNNKNSLPSSPQNIGCVPWRKTSKHKINVNTSRDVPMSCRSIYRKFDEERLSSTFQNDTASGTKDLLLKLLENWDDDKGSIGRKNLRHNSVSSELSETPSLGQRTISSLNNFFQNRTSSKKITSPFK